MAITATDYEWINDYADLAEAYCATLVRGMTPREFLRGMRAEPQGEISGYAELELRTWDFWKRHHDDKYLIGATAVPGDQGDWVLGLEVNGYLGTLPHLVEPLSRGTRLVSHFCNVNAVDKFLWYEDGTLRTGFEPLFPTEREGSTPDELVGLMVDVGFDLEEESPDLTTEAAFALAARLTGVHLTPELLNEATFVTGIVPHSATKNT
ncbi:MAG TPA: DUF6461 domain-containing protein [Spirillospora sp.]